MIARFANQMLLAVVTWGVLSSTAAANSVNWGDQGGLNDFVSDEVNFAGFAADTLVSVTSQGYFGTNNGALYPVTMTVDLELNGSWTQIYSGLTTGTTFLNGLLDGISFSYGTVTGIRASATGQSPRYVPMKNWNLGPNFTPTVFNFDAVNPPPQVPLPAGLPLLLSAFVGFGIMRKRRGSRVQAFALSGIAPPGFPSGG